MPISPSNRHTEKEIGGANSSNFSAMDLLFSKAGSYWLGQQANSHLGSVGKDANSISTTIEGKAKWLVNTVKGKVQKPLPELLKEHDLAIGMFPRDATNYEFDEKTKRLVVYIPSVCEVCYADQSVLRFATEVSCYLEKGKMTDVEGMKTKVIIWIKVSCIASEGSKLNFTAGIRRTRNREAYEALKDGVGVGKF